jgi:Fic family protein
MSDYMPPFQLTPRILDLCTRIAELAGRYEGLSFARPRIELRKENRIKTIQGTVAIEGNTLSLEQITAVLEGKPVAGPAKEIKEVRNAINAYNRLSEYNIYSMKDFRGAHKILMKDLIPDAGRFRGGGVGIARRNGMSHIAPPAHLVPTHMSGLFSFLEKNKDIHPLVKAAAFHYDLEFIHPFSDGNGRIGRLWEHAVLVRWRPVFEMLSIEAIIKDHQGDYYAALEISDKKGSCEEFIEFELGVILESLEEYFLEFKAPPVTAEDRLKTASRRLKKREFSRKDYMEIFKTISAATASRDLRYGVMSKRLSRRGDKRNTVYVFRIS